MSGIIVAGRLKSVKFGKQLIKLLAFDDDQGARIVDAGFLRTYLGSGTMISGMAMSTRSNAAVQGEHQFYTAKAGARPQFEAEMAARYVLSKFRNQTRCRISMMPTLKRPLLEIAARSSIKWKVSSGIRLAR